MRSVAIAVLCAGSLGFILGHTTHHHVTSIPRQEVYVFCQPAMDSHGVETETGAQYAACVSAVTQAWEMGQR